MAEVIIMPKLGFNMDEGELVKWHKNVGDKVSKGEVFFEINTDKTTMPVEATADGTVLKICVNEGETVEVFTPIAVVGAEGEDPEAALNEGVATASVDGTVEAQPAKEAPAAPAEASAAREQAAAADVPEGNYEYDVVVIGAGPGGYETAIKAAQSGLKTAIIETGTFGGTCLNVGCIPTKALVKTVNMYEDILRSAEFGIEGIDTSAVKISMEKLQKRKQGVVKTLVGGVQALLRGNKVDVIQGKGSFVDAHTIAVADRTVTSSYVIIATGSEVFMPGFIEYEGDTKIITSTEALALDYIPESLNIIGGGVIGIEFAYVFSHLGTKVTVLELMDHILPMVDTDVSKLARKALEKAGVVFHTGAKVKKVKDSSVIFEKDGMEQSVEAELTLMAVGRTPYTEGLNAEGIGIEFDRKAIRTDEHLRTNIDNIFAIGDVNGKVMLAHTASHEGFVAVANILGKEECMSYDRIPSCIYMEPEIASIGLTEAQAREKYDNIKIGKFPMAANGKSLIEGEKSGMMKVIIDGEYGEILGVHLFCVHATDMISEVSVAMNLESTAEEVYGAIHPHPTVAEALGEAFMAADGKAISSL